MRKFSLLFIILMLISSFAFGDIGKFFEKWNILPENILSQTDKTAEILLYGENSIPKKYVKFSGRKKKFFVNGYEFTFVKPLFVSIIIDDVPNNWEFFKQSFLLFDIPITFSIFPFAKLSKEADRVIKENGFTIQIHMPMEPFSYPKVSPGKKAIFTFQSKEKNLKILEEAIKNIPDAVGMNNHMGSKATATKKTMLYIMKRLKMHGFYFFDSHTTGKSVCLQVAKEVGILFGQNDIFLDDAVNTKHVKENLKLMYRIALRKGYVFAIGHPHRETYYALKEVIPKLKRKGVVFLSLYDLIFKLRSERL